MDTCLAKKKLKCYVKESICNIIHPHLRTLCYAISEILRCIF